MEIFAQLPALEYANQTTMSPLAAVIIAVSCGFVLLGSRTQAMIALIGIICVIPTAQRVTVAGADFDPLRLLLLAGFTRLIVRNELAAVSTQLIDFVFVAYVIVAWVSYCILYDFTPNAIVYRCGEMYTVIGVYAQSRCLLRSRDDVVRLASVLTILAIPVAGFFCLEWLTGRNMFSVFGGVPAITMIREGKLRCQGAYSHPILAGCVWAGILPIIAMMYWAPRRRRLLSGIGVIAALVIVFTTGSSTPMMMVGVVAMFAAIFPIRNWLPLFLFLFSFVAFGRWVVTDNPPWHLISRIDLVGGSTGWHRYHLMDQAIRRFPEWYLFGTRSTAHWGWGLQDVTNQYLLEGVRGGFLSMALFCLILGLAFRHLATRPGGTPHERRASVMRWCLVCALAAHSMAFFAVAYFGPVLVIYWATIAVAIAMGTDEASPKSFVIEWDEFEED